MAAIFGSCTNLHRLTVDETLSFQTWLAGLRDTKARARILVRINAIKQTGSMGDHHSVGQGVSELRFHLGPGYRVYFCRRGEEVVVLLGGGDKGSQSRDIRAARALAKEV